MVKRKDVRSEGMGDWDMFAREPVEQALPKIFAYAKTEARNSREWYWASIKKKRRASLWVRVACFLFVICGAVLPVLAAVFAEAHMRLYMTQTGVAVLALAGMLQAADKIFGWSSGWLRYVTTVMAMEDLSRRFEFDWATHVIQRGSALNEEDKLVLLQLAEQFTSAIYQLQSEETSKWVAEFGSSQALLSSLIKSHQQNVEKAEINAKMNVLSTKIITTSDTDKNNNKN